jgi:phytoene synthase
MLKHSAVSQFASAADVAACRKLLRGGSRSFFAASLLLPGDVREAATRLYAFCRLADDAIDQGKDQLAALGELQARLAGIYGDGPGEFAADRAFADCVASFSIPRELPQALLEGFAWDAQLRRYETISDVTAYAVRVAGTVGMMLAMLMQVRDARSLSRACDLGVAMQLTNIARDVGEDARCGRLYLPLEWLRQAGVDPDCFMANPGFCAGLGQVIARLLITAREFYQRSETGLSQLPAACRPGMFAARLLYAEIGEELARRGFDSVTQRAIVPRSRKARLLAKSMVAAFAGNRAHAALEPLPEAAFLIAALTSAPPPQRPHRPGVEERVVWVLDLFERLERRERACEA